MRSRTEKTYLRVKVQNASSAGLVIVLFDLLIGDIERAIAAIAEGNIEKRSAELKHAFLVLQQLDDSLDRENGGEAAKIFSAFYSGVRAKLLDAHIKISPEIFQRQIELIFDVREAWQQVDKPNPGPADAATEPAPSSQMAKFPMATSGSEVSSNTWTA
jgi:flagellar secretion chaperone FliS